MTDVAHPDVTVVIPDGVTPGPGCAVELLRAVLSAPDVGMAVARLATMDRLVVEAGVGVWAGGEVRAYGAGASRADPRWGAQREVDGALLAPYAFRSSLVGHASQGPLELGLATQASGMRVVCPAGAWATTSGRPTNPPFSLAQGLAERYAAVLADRLSPGGAEGSPGPRHGGARVLVCDRWVPRPDHHAGEKRAADLLAAFRSRGCTVTLAALSGLRRQPYTEDFEAMGVEVFAPGFDFADPLTLLEHIAMDRADMYDVVVVPWPELFVTNHATVRRCFPRARLAWDVHDLHHVRLAEQQAVSGDVSDAEIARYRELELAAARLCDVALVVNREEGDALQALEPGCQVELVPLIHAESAGAPLADRNGLLFVGGFDHPPNIDAVTWLVEEILPIIRGELPEVLTVVGSAVPPAISALSSHAVRVVGHVVDVDAYYDRARVFVAPLRFGAGVKGKNVQALARGLPLVTSTVGVQGLALQPGVDVFVEDDPAHFARAVVQLCRDDDLWVRVARGGREVARRDHSMQALTSAVDRLLPSNPSGAGA